MTVKSSSFGTVAIYQSSQMITIIWALDDNAREYGIFSSYLFCKRTGFPAWIETQNRNGNFRFSVIITHFLVSSLVSLGCHEHYAPAAITVAMSTSQFSTERPFTWCMINAIFHAYIPTYISHSYIHIPTFIKNFSFGQRNNFAVM